ncbi:MAG: ATP phosphoribosyltransferase [Gemmatimonadales bacterium]
MTPDLDADILRLALPKGRMQDEVLKLMADAGLPVRLGGREYRPTVAAGRFNAKILKPQNIIEMLAAGSRDVGFAGADWVAELGANVVELLDTGFDPVRLIAAAPAELLVNGKLPKRRLVVASEYQRITARWIAHEAIDAGFVRSYGATEVFPREDADLIVDNTATGATLAANGLTIVDTLMVSSTRLYASPASLDVPAKRAAIDGFALLLRSVLDARLRVMFEVNVGAAGLEEVCAALPCMREPTISTLHGNAGFAVKAAVPRSSLPTIIPRIKALGGSDIVITALSQLVP